LLFHVVKVQKICDIHKLFVNEKRYGVLQRSPSDVSLHPEEFSATPRKMFHYVAKNGSLQRKTRFIALQKTFG